MRDNNEKQVTLGEGTNEKRAKEGNKESEYG
jgi:hypothetical protein